MEVDFAKIKNLRLSWQYESALSLLSEVQDIPSQNMHFFEELIRILILHGINEKAAKMYNLLQTVFGRDVTIDKALYLRLKQDFPDIEPYGLIDNNYGWCTEYELSGKDLPGVPHLLDLRYMTSSHSHYELEQECSSCSTVTKMTLVGSFLVSKEYLCPNCLARQNLEYENILSFVRDKYPQLVGDKVYKYTTYFNRLRKELNNSSSSNDIPLLAAYLNQDTVFTINEYLLKIKFSN